MKSLNLPCLLVAAALIGGCADRPYQSFQEYGSAAEFANAQAAKGAAEDGSLYPRHFTGEALNSLGQTKLAQIAAHAKDAGDVVKVYLVMPEAEATEGRRQLVQQFLAEHGLSGERLALAVGPNPATADLAMLTSPRAYTRADRTFSATSEAASTEGGATSAATK